MMMYDVVYMDDDPMMTELFDQFATWKYRQWRAFSFNDPVVLYNQVMAGTIDAQVWIIDIMMPKKNGTEIAAAIRERFGAGAMILGYTALEPAALQEDPLYNQGLHLFSKIVRKNEGIASLLKQADALVKRPV
jgi:CheY-like chemotaxis protein